MSRHGPTTDLGFERLVAASWLTHGADAFFQNVCELDLVFSFYKVSSGFPRNTAAWSCLVGGRTRNL